MSNDESSNILVSLFACAEIIIDSSSAKFEVEFWLAVKSFEYKIEWLEAKCGNLSSVAFFKTSARSLFFVQNWFDLVLIRWPWTGIQSGHPWPQTEAEKIILNFPLTDNKLHFEFRFGIHYIWYKHVTKILAIWLAETNKQRIKFFEIWLFRVFDCITCKH